MEVFSRLRDWRKPVAEQEGVPVYVVFTNEQLAEMVKERAGTKAALKEIEGVGEARVEKFFCWHPRLWRLESQNEPVPLGGTAASARQFIGKTVGADELKAETEGRL